MGKTIMAVVGIAFIALSIILAGETPEPKSEIEISSLVRNLGGDFRERAVAAQQLRKMGTLAQPLLRRASRMGDAQTVQEARRLLQLIQNDRQDADDQRFQAWAKACEVDLMAVHLGTTDKPIPDVAWRVVLDTSWHLMDSEKSKYDQAKLDPKKFFDAPFPRKFEALQEEFRPVSIGKTGIPKVSDKYLLVARDTFVGRRGGLGGIFVCAGDMSVPEASFGSAVVFSAERVQLDRPSRTVVVCDGDFTSRGGDLTYCLVVCRGSVHLSHGCDQSVVVAGGDIHLAQETWNTRLSEREARFSMTEANPW